MRHISKLRRSAGSSRIRPTSIAFVAIVTLAIVFCSSHNASAGTRTWDGGGATNNWSEAANWSGDTVPDAGDDVVFDTTSPDYS